MIKTDGIESKGHHTGEHGSSTDLGPELVESQVQQNLGLDLVVGWVEQARIGSRHNILSFKSKIIIVIMFSIHS